MQAEECRDPRLVGLASRGGERYIDQTILVGLDWNVIHGEKDQGRRRAGSFVAINERMVLTMWNR